MSDQISALQTKITFQENTIEQLNNIVTQLQMDVLELKKGLRTTNKNLQNMHNAMSTEPAVNEIPPHY